MGDKKLILVNIFLFVSLVFSKKLPDFLPRDVRPPRQP